MKIEIWSDVACPWCYIGKRRLEKALDNFAGKDQIEVEYKSFQLNPTLKTNLDDNIVNYLAREKGMPLERAAEMVSHVTAEAGKEGLDFKFGQLVLANTFLSHRFLHLAKQAGVQSQAKELLLDLMFVQGRNIDDPQVLREAAITLGLEPVQVEELFETDVFTGEVRQDLLQAREFGINGVPFFVFDRKYAISGAQSPETFLQALDKAFGEWSAVSETGFVETANGENCTIDGECN